MLELKIEAEQAQLRIDVARMSHQTARWLAFANDRGARVTEDAGFLAPNRFAIVTQPVLVVKIDRSHDCRVRIDDIHRVQASTEANLKQGDIEPSVGKDPQRSQRAEFEIRQRDRFH